MTISSQINKVSYVGNGVATAFTIPFCFLEEEHINVFQQLENVYSSFVYQTDYTITGDGKCAGGTVVFSLPPAEGAHIVIMRTVPLTQEVDYRENEIFPAETHEEALDKLTMQVQQVSEKVDRAVMVGLFSDSDPSLLVDKIETLYDNRNSIAAVAAGVGDISACANVLDAIVEVPNQALSAVVSADSASSSAASALLSAESASQSETHAAASASQASVSAAAAVGLPLGFSFFSDHIIDNISYLRADTFSWQSGVTYKSMYEELVAQYNGVAETSTETLGGVTVTFKRAANGWKIVDGSQEQAVLNMYNAIGVAWYYVLDVANTRFKLPRTMYGLTGFRDVAGEYVSETLPNIEAFLSDVASITYPTATGAFSVQHLPAQAQTITTVLNQNRSAVTFKASDSSAVYQDDAPVQQRATQAYLYFFVGNFEQTAVENTAGLNAELFNGKLDRNVSNLSAEGKSLICQSGKPGTVFVAMPLGATGTVYTPVKNGWFVCDITHSSASGWSQVVFNDSEAKVTMNAFSVDIHTSWCVPVKAQQSLSFFYNGLKGILSFGFIYDEGEA